MTLKFKCPEWGSSNENGNLVYIHYRDQLVLPTSRLLGMGNLMMIRP